MGSELRTWGSETYPWGSRSIGEVFEHIASLNTWQHQTYPQGKDRRHSWPRRSALGVSPETPQANQKCASRLKLASGESRLRLLPEVGLGRVVTASPVRGWPRASHYGVSCPGSASGESLLRLSPEVGLGRVMTGVELLSSLARD
jgi:hypothetical protein